MFKLLTNTLAATLFISILAISILFLYPSSPFRPLVVLSGSMEPTLKTGSLVITRQLSDYSIDDIITFQHHGQLTTHRIIDFSTLGNQILFTTQGDANQHQDLSKTPLSRVHGKVILHLPQLGYLVNQLQTPIGTILSLAVPAFLLIISELWTIINELNQKSPRPLLIPTILLLSSLIFFSSTLFLAATTRTHAPLTDLELTSTNSLTAGTWQPTPTPTN